MEVNIKKVIEIFKDNVADELVLDETYWDNEIGLTYYVNDKIKFKIRVEQININNNNEKIIKIKK